MKKTVERIVSSQSFKLIVIHSVTKHKSKVYICRHDTEAPSNSKTRFYWLVMISLIQFDSIGIFEDPLIESASKTFL
jgi:hypothetical protein